MNLFQLLYSDYKKYKKYGGNFVSILFFTQGFWAISPKNSAQRYPFKLRIFGRAFHYELI